MASSLPGSQTNSDQPFWVDDPNPYRPSGAGARLAAWVSLGMVGCIWIVGLIALFMIPLLFVRKYPVVWIFIALEAALVMFTVVRMFAMLSKLRGRPNSAEIQRLAQEKTGAELMGSALHTAGHPLLRVDQPVVLGLRNQELSIYGYGSADPIDTIHIRDIQKIQTVTFDDEYVPHTSVVDGTAQALQITCLWRGSACVCSFRRMYKVRPIEWYQALQAARVMSGSSTTA